MAAALSRIRWWLLFCMALCTVVVGDEIFLEWHVKLDGTINPGSENQEVITINDLFPGPLINASTNDNVHINVFNDMDEPFLMTWNGIQQRLNSWQDGVSGSNCPIQPGTNWTYVIQMKDQIGSFYYFPSLNFQRAAGGFGPIRINNFVTPFLQPQLDFDLLVGDWYSDNYTDIRERGGAGYFPDVLLMNGKVPFNSDSIAYESFNVTRGKTYRFRISNVGNLWGINLWIQNHTMLLVETEGSYPNQMELTSLDVHVGQSYSVLVVMDQQPLDYYIVATPKLGLNTTSIAAVGLLHYDNSTTTPNGPIPVGPDPDTVDFSINQARNITMNTTSGAARPDPQGSFNVSNVTLSQTFHLQVTLATFNGSFRYGINNVSYMTPSTPLKLADQFLNGSGVYELDRYPVHSGLVAPVIGTFVVSGQHKGWLEIVLVNNGNFYDSWHLDGYGFFVVGFGLGQWTPEARATTYNLINPIVRSTVQVFPYGWTAVYVYLDNPGMWNLRSQKLKNWYLGQELYIRVYDPDPNPAREHPPPSNLLFCGAVEAPPAPPSQPTTPPPNAKAPPPPASAAADKSHMGWLYIAIIGILALI